MIKPNQLFLVFFATVFITFAAQARAEGEAHYGEKLKFTQGAKITFPDFTLQYLGQHRQSSEKYPRGFLFYDFSATFDGGATQFSWSSGTGDIGPAGFGFKQQRFSLELKHSDKLGRLKGDELVVWKN